jgi:hypothetical protein
MLISKSHRVLSAPRPFNAAILLHFSQDLQSEDELFYNKKKCKGGYTLFIRTSGWPDVPREMYLIAATLSPFMYSSLIFFSLCSTFCKWIILEGKQVWCLHTFHLELYLVLCP